MGLLKRGGKEAKNEQISQISFMESMNGLLDTASNPNSTIEESVENAREVQANLGRLENGNLEVQPPLNHEQFTGLRDRSDTILAVGEKALTSLESANASRDTSPEGSFEGTGSSVKS